MTNIVYRLQATVFIYLFGLLSVGSFSPAQCIIISVPIVNGFAPDKGRALSSRLVGDSDVQTGIVAGSGMCRLQSESASRVTGGTREHLSHNERAGGRGGSRGGEDAEWGWDCTAWWLGTVRPSFTTAGSSPKTKTQT